MKDGEIQDDYRIVTSFPSLDYLIAQGAKIIIGTKMGDPKGKRVPELELRPVAEYLADHYPDHTVRLTHEIEHEEVDAAIEAMKPGDMLMLPNLRFYPEEQAGDARFAERLAHLADVYVNEAFPVDHRGDTSIAILPTLLPSYAGLQLEKEMKHLGMLVEKPEHPFVVVMGGAKVSDKIEVIEALAKQADSLLIGGAMANTFLLAKGEDVSKSLVEADKVDVAKKLLDELGDKLVIAADYVKKEVDGGFSYMDIGPEAVKQFKDALGKAKTIFWNGSLGYAEDPAYAVATQEIAKFIGDLKGVQSVVAGGDTVETITTLELHDKFTFVSTGGGAALEFLAGKELPGIKALEAAPEAMAAPAEEEKSAAPAVEEKPATEPEPVKEEPKEEVKEAEEASKDEVKEEAEPVAPAAEAEEVKEEKAEEAPTPVAPPKEESKEK